jgi:hypothetical protein
MASIFDKLMVKSIFYYQQELPRDRLYERCGKFFWTSNDTKRAINELEQGGLLQREHRGRNGVWFRPLNSK